jgi:hypothetical protein
MTVSSTSSRVVYDGNGSTTTFPFGFKVQQVADLVVVYTDATGTDFTLSGSQYGATGFGVDAGGTVTYPLSGSPIASGTTLTIYRSVSPTQPTSIDNQGAMWPAVIEKALDRVTMIVQGFIDGVNRSLRITPTDGAALNPLPNATLRANSFLGFDADGQPYAAPNPNALPNSNLIAVAPGINFNSANSDNAIAIPLPTGFTRYRVQQVVISGASHSLTTATCGLFTAASGGGVAVVASASAITVSATADATANNLQSLAAASSTTSFRAGTLYFRVQTAEGAAATGDVTIFYQPLK